jgi:hypothetical protein
MTTATDLSQYEADAKARPSSEAITSLTSLTRRVVEVQREKTRLEAELKRAEEMERELTWNQIPAIMDVIGLKHFELTDGTTIHVGEEIRTSMPKKSAAEGVAWLDDNGEAGMVKRRFVIAFNRDQTALVNKFKADLARRKVPLAVTIEQYVEPPTLKSWVTRKLEEGASIPEKLFGVFRQRIAKVKVPE